MIVNDDARVINKLEASLTDDARVIIYDRHMFIVQGTGVTRAVDNQYSVFLLDKFYKLV
jgi:hypothetical protein